ncbi:MAG: polysaccharide biosynthesis/export family protein [Luteolibacter sp.]
MPLQPLLRAFLGFLLLVSSSFGEIEPGTSVQIYILGVAAEEKGKIDSIYPVAEDGTVNMPYIGRIRAGGLKAETFAAAIEKAYETAEIYQNPTIQVIDERGRTDPKEQTVFVGGHVRRTGQVSWQQHLTIYQAIQAAGGADDFGAMNRVRLYRAGKMLIYNLSDAEAKQLLVEPNDTIEVPDKNLIGK